MSNKVTFVNIDYDGLQQANYGDDYPNENDWPFLVEELAATGYKVTVSSSRTGTGLSATITDKTEASRNKSLILTAWGASVGSAVAKAGFAVSEANRLDLTWLEYEKRIKGESNQNLRDYKEYMEWKRTKQKP